MAIEDLGHHVTREYLCDSQIVIYTVIGGGQDITDAWANAMIAEITAWDIGKPYLSLQDMSQAGISAYGKKRTNDIVKSIPAGMQTYIAIVIGKTVFGRFIKMLTQSLASIHKETQLNYRFVTTREEGLRWLDSHIE